jgi:hypothetical protein
MAYQTVSTPAARNNACSAILKRLVKNPCRAPVACVLLKFFEHILRRCWHDFNSDGATWKRTHFSIGSRHVFVFFAKQDVICHLLSKPFGTFFDPGLVLSVASVFSRSFRINFD